jgi:hypothetical protein
MAKGTKHLVSFIGNGIFTDGKKALWSKVKDEDKEILTERTYNDDEFKSREDLHFMIKYGAMKHTPVELEQQAANIADGKTDDKKTDDKIGTGTVLTPADGKTDDKTSTGIVLTPAK